VGHDEIKQFLTKKWQRETRYKLRKELFAFTENKIAVQFWYEYYDEEKSPGSAVMVLRTGLLHKTAVCASDR